MHSPRRWFSIMVAILIAFIGVTLARSHPREHAQAMLHPAVVTSHYVARHQTSDAPTRRAPSPLAPEYLIAFAAVGATKKKATRRAASGKRPEIPLYLDSTVHLDRGDKRTVNGTEQLVPEIIEGGVLVDDTDLTDEEIEELQGRGVIRPARPEEVARADAKARAGERADLEREQKNELQQLRAQQEQERAKTEASGKATPEQLSKLGEKHASELTAAQDRHVKALNAFDKKGE